jgi:hypothetical protein
MRAWYNITFKPTAAGSTPRTHKRCLQANVCGKMIANVCKRCALGVTLPLQSDRTINRTILSNMYYKTFTWSYSSVFTDCCGSFRLFWVNCTSVVNLICISLPLLLGSFNDSSLFCQTGKVPTYRWNQTMFLEAV